MRKNTARKWVHLLLDLLPVLIIPIFAIYLINHNPQGLQVETGGWEIQEKYQTNDVNSVDDLIEGNLYEFNSYDFLNNNNIDDYFDINNTKVILIDDSENTNTNEVQYVSTYFLGISVVVENNNKYLSITNDYYGQPLLELVLSLDNLNQIHFYFVYSIDYDTSVSNIYQYFKKSDYNVYEYTYNEGMIYDNTDIGSQLIYSMYIPVHDYFNMTNLFNFGDIYTWINNSMFSGNAPLPIFIVYNVIVYEFLIDLIFLIYSIFMFIIDFTSELLARCFSFSNKGGTR